MRLVTRCGHGEEGRFAIEWKLGWLVNGVRWVPYVRRGALAAGSVHPPGLVLPSSCRALDLLTCPDTAPLPLDSSSTPQLHFSAGQEVVLTV